MNKLLALLAVLWTSTAAAEWNAGCGGVAQEIGVIGTPASANTGAAVAASLNVTATCPSGNTNVVAIACVSTRKPGATAVGLGTVTWAGTTMTDVGTSADTATDGSYARMYLLKNPLCNDLPQTLVIPATPTSLFMTGHILFLKNVDQTTTTANMLTNKGVSGTPTVTITSSVGQLVVDCAAAKNSNTNLVVGAGQTQASKNETTNATASSNMEGAQSYEAGGTSVVMNWTGTSSASWASVGVSVLPAITLFRHLK